MAEALLYTYDSFARDEKGYLNNVISREDYASIIGTATESAILILSEFKKEDLISTSGKHIKIKNLAVLKRIE
jgi:CRP-like cAMP-binding protein